jgi:Na+-transporting NADH:ubiquinone oxidoreductase subunit NqrB
MKGLVAGLVATLVLSGLLLLKSTMDLVPELIFITLLTNLGSISPVQAWMDHFIVGVVVFGLLFAAYDAVADRPAHWLKGIIFGVFAWLVMMVVFMPLANAGIFGSRLGLMAAAVTLAYHLVYGAVLGTTYGLLTAWVPAKAPEGSPPT